jgi:hypothetical protein
VTGATALIVETTADEDCPLEFLGESADIVYFISFAHSERYGAGHPLAKAAGMLKRRLGVDLKPLLTYADARAESSERSGRWKRWQSRRPIGAPPRRSDRGDAGARNSPPTPNCRSGFGSQPRWPPGRRSAAPASA